MIQNLRISLQRLRLFKNFKEKIIWIGGGREKGEAIERLAEVVPKHVSHAFLFGEAAVKLSSALRTRQVCFTVCSSLKEAVLSAFRAATKVADILFGPDLQVLTRLVITQSEETFLKRSFSI